MHVAQNTTQRISQYFIFVSIALLLILLPALACWIVQLPLTDFLRFTRQNRIPTYIPFLTRYIKEHPCDSKAYFARAQTYAAIGYNQLAATDYTHALALAPNEDTIFRCRAQLRFHMGDYQNALPDFNRLIRLDNEAVTSDFVCRSFIWAGLHRYQQALKDADRAIGLQPNLIDTRIARIYAYLATGDTPNAVSDCKTAQKLFPKSIALVLCLAQISEQNKDWKGVLRACNYVLSKNPGDYTALCLRAEAYNQLGNFRHAVDDATVAICCNPTMAKAYVACAQANYNLKSFDEARYDADQALYLDPSLVNSQIISKQEEAHFGKR